MQTQFISFVASISLLTVAQAQVPCIDLKERDSKNLYNALTNIAPENTSKEEVYPNGQKGRLTTHTKILSTHDNMLRVHCTVQERENYYFNEKCSIYFSPSSIDTTNVLDENYLAPPFMMAIINDEVDRKEINKNHSKSSAFEFTSSEKVNFKHDGDVYKDISRFEFYCSVDTNLKPTGCAAIGIATNL